MNSILHSVVFLLFSVLFTGSCISQRVKPMEVLSTGRTVTPPAEMNGRGVKRSRAVIFDVAPFAGAKPPVRSQMTFFPGATVVVNWTKVEGTVWTGQVEGSDGGSATMTISGKTVSANINRGNGVIYQIRTREDGNVWVREVDSSQLPGESEPVRRP